MVSRICFKICETGEADGIGLAMDGWWLRLAGGNMRIHYTICLLLCISEILRNEK